MNIKTWLLIIFYCFPVCVFSLDQICHINSITSIRTPYLIINAVQPRVQWNNNDGYCGEVSIASAGLYYGQYVSQYDARYLGNVTFLKRNFQLTQLLIGTARSNTIENNVANSAHQMHLEIEQYNNTHPRIESSKHFMFWVKKQLILNRPVFIGVYENAAVFGNRPDPEYDHITPIFGIRSRFLLNQPSVFYYNDDVIYLHDNQLYTGTGYSRQDCYQYVVSSFQKSRNEADARGGPLYSVSNNVNRYGNYGVAVKGAKTSGRKLLPVRILTDPIYELPEIQNHSNIRPAPVLMTLNIRVSALKPRKYYILLKYNSFSQLPRHDNFNRSYGSPILKCSIWLPHEQQYVTQEQILSSQTVIYRVVAAKREEAIPPAC